MPDSDLMRLLWRPTGELDQELREYKKVILEPYHNEIIPLLLSNV